MDLPAGMPIKECMNTSSIDFRKLFLTLKQHQLTGYLAVDVITNNGIEEGRLLLNNGDIIAAGYDYLAAEKRINGEMAMRLTMNALMADGRMDIYEMTDKEVINAREKNRDSVLKYKPTDSDISGMLPDSFVEMSLEEESKAAIQAQAIKSAGGVTKEDVLKKYGIAHPDQRMLDKLFEGIGDGTV